jgi:hypothetical protein
MKGQKKFARLRSLPEDYSEDAIRERIPGKRTVVPKSEVPQTHLLAQAAKFNLLINIQNCIKA